MERERIGERRKIIAKIVKETIHAKGIDIGIYTTNFENEFISLTDIAKYRNEDGPRFVIQNWMRNRDTIKFLGVWEELHNPDFNCVQFEAVKNEAGLNRFVMTPTKQIAYTYANEADMLNVVLFGKTAKQWKDENPTVKGNMRDVASTKPIISACHIWKAIMLF